MRDVRVLSDFSVDALCVVTAVTAQSDQRVTAVHHVPPDVIRAQMAAAFRTRSIGAIKIGMLGTRATVEAVVESLPGAGAAGAGIPVVVDPVLVASSGGVLLDSEGRVVLVEKLLPRAALVTPNVPEVAALLGEAVESSEGALIEQGRRLLWFGAEAILLKGGHGEGEDAVDLLISASGVERIKSKRVPGARRGTGCALASGIAAGLAAGKPLFAACETAKQYVLEMLTGVR
jgi:hydroxymethylpyrimidine/phosphomethylpyrimidine kinase